MTLFEAQQMGKSCHRDEGYGLAPATGNDAFWSRCWLLVIVSFGGCRSLEMIFFLDEAAH